jgi:hypothetical protein
MAPFVSRLSQLEPESALRVDTPSVHHSLLQVKLKCHGSALGQKLYFAVSPTIRCDSILLFLNSHQLTHFHEA